MHGGPVWRLQGITKEYPGVVANNEIFLELRSHEIHGLLGENGCGKSTLISILSGVTRPSRGVILKHGSPVEFSSPQEARAHGIATVFQEFSLVPHMTVAENLFLGQALPTKRFGLLDRQALNRNAEAVLRRLEIDERIRVTAKVASLSVAEQQLVEIAKAVSIDGTTLILDEPTAALSVGEIRTLHHLLRKLKSAGTSILYVSHRLDEVVEIVDRATILKDGMVVSAADETPIKISEIARRMIGSDPSEFFRSESNATEDVVFSASGLRAPGVNAVSFELRRGEVLGIAGVMGSGRTELLMSLFGATQMSEGEMRLFGKLYRPRTPREAISRGVALVPENRKTDGLFFNLPSPANASIAALWKITFGALLSRSRELTAFEAYRQSMRLPAQSTAVTPKGLSGGNQQKLVLARWMFAGSGLILMDEPTQGVDVGAKASIYELVRALTREGKAAIVVSSDLEELLAMSDRVAIYRSGEIIEIVNASGMSEQELAERIAIAGNIKSILSEENWT